MYGKEYEVPESKMGKGSAEADMDKERTSTEKGYPLPTSAGEGSRVTAGGATLHIERPRSEKKEEPKIKLDTVPRAKEKSMEKSLNRLAEMAKSVAPAPGDEAVDLLKACKACMDKGPMGSFKITSEGPKQEKTGKPLEQVQKEETLKKPPSITPDLDPGAKKSMEEEEKATPITLPISKGEEGVEKAMTSRAVPRMPPAMRQEMIRRNAQSVMTRGNSRFAKDIHTGPLTGEVVEEVEGDAMRRTTQEVYKSCNMCGRRFMEKSFPDGCPTCSVNKSNHCATCGMQLLKSHGGSVNCPLCG
jgi:hypothetical protein